MKKYFSELIGTFALVFIGLGAFIIGGGGIGILGVAIAYGLAIIGIYSAIGRISGAHINPAVTLGALVSKRITPIDSVFYILSQLAGAILGAISVWIIAMGNIDYQLINGLGQNGFGASSLANYPILSVIIFELIATFLFVYIFLSATSSSLYCSNNKKTNHNAGIGIGAFFTAFYLVGLPISGASLNPARSFGPAFLVGFVDKTAWSQLWVFLVFPVIGGLLAGVVYNLFHKESIDKDVEFVEIEIIEE